MNDIKCSICEEIISKCSNDSGCLCGNISRVLFEDGVVSVAALDYNNVVIIEYTERPLNFN